MFRSARTRLVIASAAFLVALVTLSALVGIAQSELQLGGQSYSRASARSLRIPVTRSVRFFAGVGGVAFRAVAQGQLGQVVSALKYDPAAPDGQRLLITVKSKDLSTQTVRGRIYDWQLVPLAEYARDENGSAVTLFGKLENKTLESQTLASGGRVINYHPKLDNTLLGLRLFQADILIIQPNAADLFKEGGRLIIGAGEAGHDLPQNRERFQQIALWQGAQEERGNQYQSYVVGDLDQRVTFVASDQSIAFTGEPYWNAWRRKYRTAADLAKVDALENQYSSNVSAYNVLVEAVNAGKGNAGASRIRMASLQEELNVLEKQLEELNAIEQMPEYSRALSQRIKELNGINPIVYRTVTTVMHYRALFKHFQRQNQPGFTAFVDSLNGVVVRPMVATPTIQKPDVSR